MKNLIIVLLIILIVVVLVISADVIYLNLIDYKETPKILF